jgi:hypothetical protein
MTGEVGASIGNGTAKLPVEETGVPRRMCVVNYIIITCVVFYAQSRLDSSGVDR